MAMLLWVAKATTLLFSSGAVESFSVAVCRSSAQSATWLARFADAAIYDERTLTGIVRSEPFPAALGE